MRRVGTVLGSMEFGRGQCVESVPQEMVDAFLNHKFDSHQIDTAYMYTGGQSEEIIGGMSSWREQGGNVATKLNPWDGKNYKEESLRDQINTCLTRLKSDKVELLYLHAPDHKTDIEETMRVMDDLHKAGKFAKLGLSNYSSWEVARTMEICRKHDWVQPTVYQGMYSCLTRSVEDELFPCLRHYGISFYAYSPLAGGLLTGKYTFEQEKEKTISVGRFNGVGWDKVYRQRYWKKEYFDQIEGLKALLKETYPEQEVTLAEAAFSSGNSSEGPQPAAQRSIQSFFSSQVNKVEKKVPCPVCSQEVVYKSINAHLDVCTGGTSLEVQTSSVTAVKTGSIMQTKNGSVTEMRTKSVTEVQNGSVLQIRSGSVTEVQIGSVKNKGVIDNYSEIISELTPETTEIKIDKNYSKSHKNPEGKTGYNEDRNICIESKADVKRKIEQADTDQEKNSKKLKRDDEFSDEENESDMLKICLDTERIAQGIKSPAKKNQTITQNTIKLSPSISYNTARYGGIQALGGNENQFVRTSSKTAAMKYSPKKRSRSTLPDMPQHDPYTPSKRKDPDYVPYYVTNFEYIISCVIDCTDDWQLFSDQELRMVETYRSLPLAARKLYVRLFNRRHAWILETGMKYDECPDIPTSAHLLVTANLLLNKENLDDVEECLNILVTPEIKILAKEFNIPAKISSKQEIIQELKKMCEKKSIFQSKSSLKDKVLKRARSLVGSCYKLDPEHRSVLNRVLCLWGVTQWWGEREDERPPNSLTTLLLANQGKLIFPQYHIIREQKIFRGREDLINCETAMKLVDKIENALGNKDFEAGLEVYKQIKSDYKDLLTDNQLMDFVKGLPVFLRKLTTPAVYVYGLSKCVDLLEKRKEYSDAVDLLKLLLDTDFIFRYRGVWYERLCLDLETHLKQPASSLDQIESALDDSSIRGARRLALHHRVTKICKSKRHALETRLETFTSRSDWQDPTSQDLPTIVISGKMVSKEGVSNTKSVFILTKNGETTYCNVEELVRDYYKDEGLHEGCHAEGSLLNSILTLLFWDIIYHSQIPDAFRDPAQSSPLDWDTDDFYVRRKDLIDQRLLEIADMSTDDIVSEVEDYFTSNFNVSSMVNWDLFRGPEHISGLLRCFEPKQLAQIMDRMIKDHRTYRSGLPDLTCWNPDSQTLKFVEVKGPGDKLSYKQILWIRFFISIGVTAEVCHVDPTGSFHSTGVKRKSGPSSQTLKVDEVDTDTQTKENTDKKPKSKRRKKAE